MIVCVGPFPPCIFISQARQHDVRSLDDLIFGPGTFYIMDRIYMDFREFGFDRTRRLVLCHTRQGQPALLPPTLDAGTSETFEVVELIAKYL